MNTVITKINNCLDCTYHKVIPDPDPNDWFCDDDVAIVCTNEKAPQNQKFDLNSKYKADRQLLPLITVSCRPHHIRKEANIPDWCPLLDKGFINNCDKVIPEALRYLAENERPSYGNDRFNSEHLFQLAEELEKSL